jgi:hypothetical protein
VSCIQPKCIDVQLEGLAQNGRRFEAGEAGSALMQKVQGISRVAMEVGM